MSYEFNKRQFAKALKKTKKKAQTTNVSTVQDVLRFQEVGELQDVTIPSKLSLKGELTLQSHAGGEIPDDIMFPVELNTHLRNRIQELSFENGRLQRELEEKEADLRTCMTQNEQLLSDSPSPLFGLGRASELAASKIVELSKRLRELTAENEGSKMRWREAERKLRAYEEGSEIIISGSKQGSLSEIDTSTEASEDEVKSLTEKLNVSMNKLCEARNQNLLLKQEVKLVNKALSSEVGESVSERSVQSIIGTTNWRGRAQQIAALQQKVSDLHDKLKEANGEQKVAAKNSGLSAVHQIEKERLIAHEQVTRELQDKKQQLEDVKRKLDATRARCKVLEVDLEKKKRTIDHYTLTDGNDKELIRTMSAELARMEQQQLGTERKEHKKVLQWEEKYNTVQELLARERSKNEQLDEILHKKDDRIQQYRKAAEGDRAEDPGTVRHHYPSSRQHSQSGDGVLDTSESHTLVSAAEVERVRLLELVSVLNRRLEEQRNGAAETEEGLRRERARCARLETKVGRLEMERHGLARTDGYAGSRHSLADKTGVPEGVKNKMELMEEEILALKARLSCVRLEKEEDLKAYKNSFEEAKSVFLEGSRAGSVSVGRSSLGSR